MMCHIMIYRQTSKYLRQKTMVRFPRRKKKKTMVRIIRNLSSKYLY